MALKILETLVLRGIRVAGDVVTDMARTGSLDAKRQAPAHLSYPRHLSQRFGRFGQAERRILVGTRDENTAVAGAGRSRSHAGVLVNDGLAMSAGWAVLSGWPNVVPCPVAAASPGFTAKPAAFVDPATSRSPLAVRMPVLATDSCARARRTFATRGTALVAG